MNRLFKRIFGIEPIEYRFPKINTKRELYLKLCDDVDDILIKSGIRKICIGCSTIKPFRKGCGLKGCCNGCKYITSKGCSTKSLSCKLCLCEGKLETKIRKARFWTKWKMLKRISKKNEWFGCEGCLGDSHTRRGIDDYYELEV